MVYYYSTAPSLSGKTRRDHTVTKVGSNLLLGRLYALLIISGSSSHTGYSRFWQRDTQRRVLYSSVGVTGQRRCLRVPKSIKRNI